LIGSAYRKASRLQEAKEATEKSLELYAAAAADEDDNAAIVREQLGLIYEDMGQLSDARESRLRGASKGEMLCTSLQVC
jgi:tetratricopeptide (TPR) repeat protein